MSENHNINDEAVDRRAETIVTEQPGFVATEQVTTDVAAESRQRSFLISRILFTVLSVLEILLGIRFVLKLIAANPGSGFAVFIYGITGLFTAPFETLVGTPSLGGSNLEITTLIAMAIYALFFWVLVRIIHIAGGSSFGSNSHAFDASTNPRCFGQWNGPHDHYSGITTFEKQIALLMLL